MRNGSLTLAVLGVLVGIALCDDQAPGTLLFPCPQGTPGAASCNPSKKDLKAARSAFARAVKLQEKGHPSEAMEEFETAARLAPRNPEYVTAREVARQHLVYNQLTNGNKALLEKRPVEAIAAFRNAAELDPNNEFAQQRLKDAAAEWAPAPTKRAVVAEDHGEVHVVPRTNRSEFHIKGDTRTMFTQVAAAYGISVMFDDSVPSKRVRFDIDSVDFDTAIRAATAVTRTFWVPLDTKQILVANDTTEAHRQYDRMGLRTFYVSGASTPQELTDVVNLFRTMFEVRFITPQPQNSSVVVRAPIRVLDTATKFLEGLDSSRPQVVLDVNVYQISNTYARNLGLQIPNTFQLFNIPVGALAALGGKNIQDLINQLIANGGINQANSQQLSALLAQLQGQQNSIFAQPLATFGSGLTLMGLSLGTLGAQLSLNESSSKTLEHATLRASQGNDVTFRLGTRYPILNASFAPVFNTPAISQVIQNNSFQAPFPSFSYEDLGLTLKAKPSITGNTVALQMEMGFRTLLGASLNGVPIIANREYKGSINLLDGEPAVVAGSISRTDQTSMNGIPGLGKLPGLNKIATSNTKQENEDELLLVITPHIVATREQASRGEVWLEK